jgi:hypothetical protein
VYQKRYWIGAGLSFGIISEKLEVGSGNREVRGQKSEVRKKK